MIVITNGIIGFCNDTLTECNTLPLRFILIGLAVCLGIFVFGFFLGRRFKRKPVVGEYNLNELNNDGGKNNGRTK